MSPVIIKALGNREYGLWELVMSVIGYMGLLDLGIGPALVRFISVADAEKNRDDLQQIISTAMTFLGGIGVLSLLGFVLLSVYPQVVTGKDSGNIAHLCIVFLLFGLNAGIVFPLQVFITTLMGVQRHYCINITRGVLELVRAVITYRLFHLYPGKGLLILAALQPIFSIIQFVIFYITIRIDTRLPDFSFTAVSKKKMWELFAYGIKSSTMMIASRLQNQSVPFIISNILGIGHIVYFVIPNRLVDYSKGLSQALGFPLTPYFGASVGRGDGVALKNSWLVTSLALQVVSLAMPFFILAYGKLFLGLWIGQEYAQAGRGVLYCLLVGLLFDGFSSNAFRLLLATSHHGKAAAAWLILSFLSIPAGVIAAQMWGVVGVAVAVTGVTVIGNIVTLVFACRVIEITLLEYAKATLSRLLIPLSLLLITLAAMAHYYEAAGYFSIIVQCMAALSVYIVSVWFFVLDAKIRKSVLERIVCLKSG